MKKYKIGYTQGTFDMFHVGHLNLINKAKEQCDFLIVGINSDELVEEYKHHTPIIPDRDRMIIVSNVKSVDNALVVNTLDKVSLQKKLKFEVIFIGDDWKDNARWIQTEKDLQPLGCSVVYINYTDGISSSILRSKLNSKK